MRRCGLFETAHIYMNMLRFSPCRTARYLFIHRLLGTCFWFPAPESATEHQVAVMGVCSILLLQNNCWYNKGTTSSLRLETSRTTTHNHMSDAGLSVNPIDDLLDRQPHPAVDGRGRAGQYGGAEGLDQRQVGIGVAG